MRNQLPDGGVDGQWWRRDDATDRIVCELCPRECHLKEGDKGFCFVRENRQGKLILSTYGKSTGFCIDPIEKKPLNHFLPGTSVLSFGTAGCNLGCKFCQNWEISKSREVESLSQQATPDAIAAAAVELGCRSVAFTYNDPVVWAEYAIDTAKACRERGIRSVAVTAGYITRQARQEFYEFIDAANVDLKGFTEDFYWKVTNAHLEPVLETLKFLKNETQVWFELTNLVIPQNNDDREELRRMCDWIVEHLGCDVPLHFSAFHPDFRMRDLPNTPHETLIAAYDIARSAGIRYPFVGNVHDPTRQSTYCPNCRELLIERDWYQLGTYHIHDGQCARCGTSIAGHFENKPGDWGSKRQPVDMRPWSKQPLQVQGNSKAPPMTSHSTLDPIQLLDADRLTDDQKVRLTQVAGRLIASFASGTAFMSDIFDSIGDLKDRQVFGVFTTLKRGELLRGCCGSIGRLRPLSEQLYNACLRTATQDVRMPAISPYELPYLRLDISLLENMEPITQTGQERLQAFEIGRHGLVIQRGSQSGLLLPAVSVEQGWDAEQFLRGVCRKAGLPEHAWLDNDTLLNRFAGIAIHGQFDPEVLKGIPKTRGGLINQDQLHAVQNLVVSNLSGMARGLTPTYYFPHVPDGTVHGIVLSMYTEMSKRPILHLIRVSMRPGLPLQSTLFELTQLAVEALRQLQGQGDSRLEVALTVLHDPAAHGWFSLTKDLSNESALKETIRQHIGLEGLPGSRRALIATTGSDAVYVSFDPDVAPAFQLMEAAKTIGFHGNAMQVFSMEMISTRPTLVATNVPTAKNDQDDRWPAVAGGFYPAGDEERQREVADIVRGLPPKGPQTHDSELLAIMTPHAGLKYSGRIAASAWREVDFPRRLIIVGPKHTSDGVGWAIAPCRKWRLSENVSLTSDFELGHRLVQAIDGLQWDAAAHRREHGIEVQLPLIEHFSPQSSLVGVAIHGASWPKIQEASKGLADILRQESDRPLLVISSDMNHYASDSETRRRDRLALDAILSKDPQRLIRVCQENEISMCGLIPAAWVLQTLIELGTSFTVEQLGYATSGEVQPSDRVVGYAALAFRESSP